MAAVDLFKPVATEMEDLDSPSSPDSRRRLSEKVLAAFNYAYAIGAREVAERLHAILAKVEAEMEASALPRSGGNALKQAELWVAYIEARNRYQAVCRSGRDSGKILTALEAMKEAYKRWSVS